MFTINYSTRLKIEIPMNISRLMHKKFEINRTKIKGGCHLGSKVVTHNSMSDLPLVHT